MVDRYCARVKLSLPKIQEIDSVRLKNIESKLNQTAKTMNKIRLPR